jgi:hypothetical protein
VRYERDYFCITFIPVPPPDTAAYYCLLHTEAAEECSIIKDSGIAAI